MSRFTDFLLYLTVATFPLYLLPSGGLQLSHFFFLLFVLSFRRQIRDRSKYITVGTEAAFRNAAIFVGIVFAVQLFYAVLSGQPSRLIYAVFYAFDLSYMVSIYLYLRVGQQRSQNVLFGATVTGVYLVFGGLLLGISGDRYRASSFFNNPNQLGYFALLTTIILLVFHTRTNLRYAKVFSLVAVGMAGYLALASLSKAAMIGVAVSALLFAPIFKKSELALIVLTLLCTAPLWIEKATKSDFWGRAVMRLETVGVDHDDNFTGRGYDRIVENPGYLILGAGEGGLSRFGAKAHFIEIHSTFASIAFCYGICGFLAFLTFNFRCYQSSPLIFVCLFAPVFAYGLTHNGSRFSFLWLLYALYLYISDRKQGLWNSTAFPSLRQIHFRQSV